MTLGDGRDYGASRFQPGMDTLRGRQSGPPFGRPGLGRPPSGGPIVIIQPVPGVPPVPGMPNVLPGEMNPTPGQPPSFQLPPRPPMTTGMRPSSDRRIVPEGTVQRGRPSPPGRQPGPRRPPY